MILGITPNFTPRIQTQNNQTNYMAKTNSRVSQKLTFKALDLDWRTKVFLNRETLGLFQRVFGYFLGQDKKLVKNAKALLDGLKAECEHRDIGVTEVTERVLESELRLTSISNKSIATQTGAPVIKLERLGNGYSFELTQGSERFDITLNNSRYAYSDKDKLRSIHTGTIDTLKREGRTQNDDAQIQTTVQTALRQLFSDLKLKLPKKPLSLIRLYGV